MKVAIVYNRESRSVINLFGNPNQEKIGLKTIKRIADALRAGGHQVTSMEADKNLVTKLEEFMPSVVKGERPGLVFNVSYGLQGQARYTHVPSILEMVGIPYVGSGPLAHSLALDKVVAKMVFEKNGLPTPAFAVLDTPDGPAPDIAYPLIVKPKDEAVSFGVKVCANEAELRAAAGAIFEKFNRPVLVERYIDGREVNVGILGNDPPEALPAVELQFGEGGPAIYTYEDKTRRSKRVITPVCPAPLGEELTARVQELAIKAFRALGCSDCARVDLRLDSEGNPYILEINSLPSLGEHGSFVEAAAQGGRDYTKLVNRLVEVASARYFGTPAATSIELGDNPASRAFEFLTSRRDRIEKRIGDLASRASRSADPVGLQTAVRDIDDTFRGLGLEPAADLSDNSSISTWQTRAGLDRGTLLIVHADVPVHIDSAHQPFRRDPQWLFGEGVGCVHAPTVSLEYALRALRRQKVLAKTPLGVVVYSDEGQDCRYSGARIAAAAARAGRVLVLRPSSSEGKVITQRRGLRRFRLTIDGAPRRLGQAGKRRDLLTWTWERLAKMTELSSRKERVAIAVTDVKTTAQPMRLPHRAVVNLLVGYPEPDVADRLDTSVRAILDGDKGGRWQLAQVSDRPAMMSRKPIRALYKKMAEVAGRWEIPFGEESSLWPSVAGLVPDHIPVLCGLGPVAHDLYTSQEAVQRMSLLQRALLLTMFLLETSP